MLLCQQFDRKSLVPTSSLGERGSAAPPPAILRAGTILSIVAAANGTPIKATALAKALGIPRSSAVNICSALLEIGLLSQGDHGYALGHRLGELGQAYFEAFSPVKAFTDYCQGLRPPLTMTVQLGTLDDLDVVYLAKHEGDQPLSIASRVGGRLPANCTALGKAMLSSLKESQLDGVLESWSDPLPALTAKSHSTVGELRLAIEESKVRGYAVDDEETTPGIVCLAVPLTSSNDASRPYAVSGSLLKSAATEANIARAVGQLVALAKALSGR